MRQNQKTTRGRELRQETTAVENILWYHLRKRQINGRKFRRQYPIGPFIVDFCCVELRLVVELDGDPHAFQEQADMRRQAYLEGQGYRVMRFPNSAVRENLRGVLETLWHATEGDPGLPSP